MNVKKIKQLICSEEDMLRFGTKLSRFIQPGDVFFFSGALGAGKTTLIRGLLRGLGYTGFVKSPSYTLFELYDVHGWVVVHMDLYRINDENSVRHLGVSDYLTENSILLIEWPNKVKKYLPSPTLCCHIAFRGEQRALTLAAERARTQRWLYQLAK